MKLKSKRALRRFATEVEPKADKVGRRFQPPGRRKERPAKPAAVLDPGPGGPATPGGTGGRLGSGGAPTPTPKEPKPPAATVPSAEMAWLLRVSERFDEEAREAPLPESPYL